MSAQLAGYHYAFEPGTSGRTLLLLHGTGGDERDLLPIGRMIAPHDALLSPRGTVLEHGMPRFFRRLREGVLDVPDLVEKAHDMARFVASAAHQHQFDAGRVIAVGYSNGANLASAMMLEGLPTLQGAALLRAMVPYEPRGALDLHGRRVLLLAGRRDPYSGSPATERLAGIFQNAGAEVRTEWSDAGHEIAGSDAAAARMWLA